MITSFLIFVVLPTALFFMFFQTICDLEHGDFYKKWGKLYHGLKTKSKNHLSYFIIFALRRILFCFFSFFIENETLQLLSIQYLNLAVMMYIFHLQRHRSKIIHQLILFNECCIGAIHIILPLFTEAFDTSPEVHNQSGWAIIAIVAIMVTFDLLYVIFFGIRQVFIIIKKGAKMGWFYLKKILCCFKFEKIKRVEMEPGCQEKDRCHISS